MSESNTYADFKGKVVERTNKIYKNHTVKQRLHPVWHTALAFFEGKQWRRWVKSQGLKDFKPANVSRKIVVNKIEKIVTTFVAHFERELPTFLVNPNSESPDDTNASQLSETVLKVEYTPMLEAILGSFFYWKFIIGTGIRGLFWNPTASAEIKLPILNPDTGEEESSEVRVAPDVGKIYSKVINPFNFYPVGGADIDDCTEILYVEALPLDMIQSLYDFKATKENIKVGESSSNFDRDFEEGHTEKFEERAKVFQYYRKESKSFPNGLFSVVINEKVVKYQANPYLQWGCNYPFFRSRAIPIPGQFWGKSPVEQLRKVQIVYNYVYSLIVTTMERMGKLKWWVPKNAGIEDKVISNKIGDISFYTAQPNVPPPQQASLSPLPYYYFQILDQLDKSFEDISGFHEVKSARLPTGANNPSGVMVNLLLEQDETRLAPAVREYLTTCKNEAKLYLKMVQKLYEEDRILRVVGEDKSAEIIDFRGSKIMGNDDVQVELAPILSDSRASWEQTVWKALELGAIDARTAVRKLKLEHPKTVLNELADERLALRENILMRAGEQRGIQEWEDDQVHLSILESFMRTPTFEKLPGETQGLFIEHRKAHQEQEAKKFQQTLNAQVQQAQQMAMATQPPQEGQVQEAM